MGILAKVSRFTKRNMHLAGTGGRRQRHKYHPCKVAITELKLDKGYEKIPKQTSKFGQPGKEKGKHKKKQLRRCRNNILTYNPH